ncbi:COQ9 family protein [Tropicibacter oceani]|uniref:COQ9 family protein n=1 Tax=Tropicibacter oceani TaxID=3058420 RepID=A0ABY8QMW1_9RHOB|nr:COQ9 family protein [Tropicibacter oceani]WGW05348.1 COQ9 family protein [Tropicibacter oceani]
MPDTLQTRLLDAILMHVPFDGWSEPSFAAAIEDAGVDPVVARSLFPRGAVDLAVAYHKAGDAEMLRRIEAADLSEMRFRDKVAFAVRARIEAVDDREVVRRGTALFALPMHAVDGAKLIWGTADAIWNALGDSSRDFNWYTKRATLSAVYSSTVLYWLGDESPENTATWEFLDRRIEDVMRFEKTKAQMRDNPLLSRLMAGPGKLAERIKAPDGAASDLPGGG